MSPSRSKSPVAWVVASILLLVAVIASFWVPIYARSAPKLGAFPFFYWYQLILVPAVAIVSWIAYLLVRTDGGGVAAAPPEQAPDAIADGGDGPEATR